MVIRFSAGLTVCAGTHIVAETLARLGATFLSKSALFKAVVAPTPA
jgi:hypothetical protein